MSGGWMARPTGKDQTHACNCIGPQNGEPLCPCMMRSVVIENGRYVRRQDLGPAPGRKPSDEILASLPIIEDVGSV